ncbi:MAG: UDP-N-acetylglucosamine 2-epimerase [Terracidiphilus sp.]
MTGSRAEYGLLYPVMRALQQDAGFELSIVVTGMHLSPTFGLTSKVIESDGFTIDAKVEMLLSSDTPIGIAKSVGLGVSDWPGRRTGAVGSGHGDGAGRPL